MLLVLTVLVVWLYVLSVLTRGKLYFAKFLVGCFGLFFFMMYFLSPIFVLPLGNAVATIAGIPGRLTGFYESYPEYSLIFISRPDSFISFYIDYECSGIIEMLAFAALLWFFPLYNTAEKAIVSIVGIGWIFMSNVIRILIISMVIHIGGNNVFYFTHTVLGRIIFYGLSVVLYFYVFTKPHIVRQKVGVISYGGNSNKTG